MTRDLLVVDLKPQASGNQPDTVDNDRLVLRVPWKKTPVKRRCEIIVPASESPQDRRLIRAETRATLVASIARGRRWLEEIIVGTVTSVEQIAAREKCSIRQVNRLPVLAPELIKRALAAHGGTLADVVKQAVYVTDIRYQAPVSKCRREAYANGPIPINAFLVISGLAIQGMLLEIDVTAVVSK
jgi:hypothetical protein